MPKYRYRKALAALALAACLGALPAAAAAPAAQTAETAAGTAAQGGAAGNAGGLGTAAGGALLVGVGAYSFVRRQWQDEREQQRAAPGPSAYFENHTRNGTLRPEERSHTE